MFTIHFFEEDKPKFGEVVLVQISNDETVQASLHENDEGTLYWEINDTGMTIAAEGNEKWVSLDELWSVNEEFNK